MANFGPAKERAGATSSTDARKLAKAGRSIRATDCSTSRRVCGRASGPSISRYASCNRSGVIPASCARKYSRISGAGLLESPSAST